MNFLIIAALNTWNPKIPPNTTATAASMITMRLVIAWARLCGTGTLIARRLHELRLGAVRIGRDVDAVPPAAAQRLEQRGGVGIARRLRLHQAKPRLQVAALRIEQDQIGDRAQPILAAREIERVGCRAHRALLGFERRGVQLQGAQHIGDVLERDEHGVLVLRLRHLECRLGGALLMQQGETMEDRLRAVRRDAPDGGARA